MGPCSPSCGFLQDIIWLVPEIIVAAVLTFVRSSFSQVNPELYSRSAMRPVPNRCFVKRQSHNYCQDISFVLLFFEFSEGLRGRLFVEVDRGVWWSLRCIEGA